MRPGPTGSRPGNADLARERARERLERVAAGSSTCRRRGDAGRVGRDVPRRPQRDRDHGRARRSPAIARDEGGLARAAVRLDRADDDGIERRRRAPGRRRSRRRSASLRRRPRRPTRTASAAPRPRPGATVDDVSAGVRSVGSGMIARIRVVGARAIGAARRRRRATSGQRPLGQLAREREVRRPTRRRRGRAAARPPASQRAEVGRAGPRTRPGRPVEQAARRGGDAASPRSVRARSRIGGRTAAGRRRPGSRRSPRPPGPAPWASARMSSASLIVTPLEAELAAEQCRS